MSDDNMDLAFEEMRVHKIGEALVTPKNLVMWSMFSYEQEGDEAQVPPHGLGDSLASSIVLVHARDAKGDPSLSTSWNLRLYPDAPQGIGLFVECVTPDKIRKFFLEVEMFGMGGVQIENERYKANTKTQGVYRLHGRHFGVFLGHYQDLTRLINLDRPNCLYFTLQVKIDVELKEICIDSF